MASLEMPDEGGMQVTVAIGRNFRKANMTSFYCQMVLKQNGLILDHMAKTRPQSGRSPKWNETASFNLSTVYQTHLHLEVWSTKTFGGSDSVYAEANIVLGHFHFEPQTPASVWVLLQSPLPTSPSIMVQTTRADKVKTRPSRSDSTPDATLSPRSGSSSAASSSSAPNVWTHSVDRQKPLGFIKLTFVLNRVDRHPVHEYALLSGYLDAHSVVSRELSRVGVDPGRVSSGLPPPRTLPCGKQAIFVGEPEHLQLCRRANWKRLSRTQRLGCDEPASGQDLKTVKCPMSADYPTFVNWGESQTYRPRAIFYPETCAHVQQVVMYARSLGIRLKPFGTGHSWSPMFGDNDSLYICMERMKGITKDLTSKKPADWRVTIGPGVTSGLLKQFCMENDIYVPSSVVTDVISLGGIFSTGSHGVGMDQGLISDNVVEVVLVDSSAKVRRFSSDKNPEEMRAIGCSFGLFGVLIAITFRVFPARNALVLDYRLPLRQVFQVASPDRLPVLKDFVLGNYTTEILWFPYNSDCWVKVWNPTERAVTDTSISLAMMNIQQYLQIHAGAAVTELFQSPNIQRFTPTYLRRAFDSLPFGERICKIPEAIHWQKHLSGFTLWDMEFCMPVSPDFSNICEATMDVVRVLDRFEEQGKYPSNIGLEMRFVRGSDKFMAPCNINKAAIYCYIEVLTAAQTPYWEEFCLEVAHLWLSKNPTAIPHWGKYHQTVPGIVPHVKKLMAPEIQQFLKVRAKAKVDPSNMFSNSYLDSIFDLTFMPKPLKDASEIRVPSRRLTRTRSKSDLH